MPTVSFLVLMNEVLRVVSDGRASECMDGDEKFADLNADSLNVIMLASYMIDFYGLSQEISRHWMPTTPNEMYDYIWRHKTREPESIAECLEFVQ